MLLYKKKSSLQTHQSFVCYLKNKVQKDTKSIIDDQGKIVFDSLKEINHATVEIVSINFIQETNNKLKNQQLYIIQLGID